jgi:lysozyme
MNMAVLHDLIIRHERKAYKAYPDSEGILTIGIGMNLEERAAKPRILDLGVDYDQLCAGNCELTDAHIMALFSTDLNVAIQDAAGNVSNFWAHPDDVQHAIVDMNFNLGGPRFAKFVKAIAAFENKDYRTAAAEMSNSKWAKQVGQRAQEDIDLVLRCA